MPAFSVSLCDASIGRLELLPDGYSTRLLFFDDYRNAARRPLLGQQFKSFHREYRQPSRLLNFFTHLLPEGALAGILRRAVKLSERQDWQLLEFVGRDLPGAIRLVPVPDDDTDPARPEPEVDLRRADPPTRPTVPPEQWHFSLSGVQLKFSMSWLNERLTLPADTINGKWIVKLGDSDHPDLPEVEWSVMEWARLAGIDTPTTKLESIDRLDGIPAEFLETTCRSCFAIERFDRGEDHRRIHMEDFAQVLNADDKYQGHSYETIGNVIANVCGPADLREYVRRLLFMTLSGNADAHLKNWSLLYPDGVHARLSPAYDLLSVVAYPGYERRLALNFNGSKRFEGVSLAGFSRFARKIKFDEAELLSWVREDVPRILQAWSDIRGRVPLSTDRLKRIDAHFALLNGAPDSLLHL